MTQTLRLDYQPRRWQAAAHRAFRRFSVLVVHRRAGKTVLALSRLVDAALKEAKSLGSYSYIAPQLKQAKAVAWQRLKLLVRPLADVGAIEILEADLMIRFLHNGALLRLLGADNPDALRGIHLDGCVMDEVAQHPPELWREVVQPALADRMGWALFIGTPKGVNLFSELYFGGLGKADWYCGLFTINDTDHGIAPGEVARLKADMSEAEFAREFLCDFSAAADDQLISVSNAEAAAGRRYNADAISHAPRILGVDVGRFGGDRFVVFPRQGLVAYPPIVRTEINNMDAASVVINKVVEWEADAVFIDQGAGSGIIDRIRQLGHDCIEVPFGSKATFPERFFNKRSEMYWLLREWLAGGGSIPNDPKLKQEIATPTYRMDGDRRRLEGKDEIKKRLGGGSPDLADALALTFAHPVEPRDYPSRPLYQHPNRRKAREYDPYAKAR